MRMAIIDAKTKPFVSRLLHLPHHTGLHLEEIVLAVFEEAVFEVVAPGGGALEEVEHLPDHAELHI